MSKTVGISRLQSQSGRYDSRNMMGFMLLLNTAGIILNLLLSLGLLAVFIGLVNKPVPSLVQLEAGRTIAVEELGKNERTPAVIQRFVEDTLTGLMSASGQLSDGAGGWKNDPGISVGDKQKVPTVSYLAAFGLSQDFQFEFLQLLSKTLPPSVFTSGGEVQRVLIPQNISPPQSIGEGEWKVVFVGNLVTTDPDLGRQTEQFNREIFVRSVVPPAPKEYSSLLEQQVSSIRSAGLEIYAIRPYTRQNIPANLDQ